MPASARSATTQTSARTTAVSAPTKFESDLLGMINRRRTAIGCSALSYRSTLAYAARQHTSRMIAAHEVSHQLSREPSLATRITNAGYTPWRWLAENLAEGTKGPYATYTLWMHSAPHRANIENCNLRNAGIGSSWAYGVTWNTIDFGRQ
ncbi:CAP domain-containing protein [Nocardioides marmorisolisilvae]|nr:CAP domain-containing protein [Nocardioides marmorisolisilvae]